MRFVSARHRVHPLSLRKARLRVSDTAQLHDLPGVPVWPVSAPGRAIHLLPVGELFGQGYSGTSVVVCGEPVTSGPDSEEDLSYCPDCASEVLRWCAQPGAGESEHSGGPRR
jgi:hypothetical protein